MTQTQKDIAEEMVSTLQSIFQCYRYIAGDGLNAISSTERLIAGHKIQINRDHIELDSTYGDNYNMDGQSDDALMKYLRSIKVSCQNTGANKWNIRIPITEDNLAKLEAAYKEILPKRIERAVENIDKDTDDFARKLACLLSGKDSRGDLFIPREKATELLAKASCAIDAIARGLDITDRAMNTAKSRVNSAGKAV